MTTVSVVTGANSGIGRATALHLAGLGHEVFGSVRNLDSAAKLRSMADEAGVEVGLFTMDVADDESVRRGMGEVLERAGRVDVLVTRCSTSTCAGRCGVPRPYCPVCGSVVRGRSSM